MHMQAKQDVLNDGRNGGLAWDLCAACVVGE